MRILFVGRHNNDIDHMVPIAAHLARNPEHVVHYFIAAPALSWRTDCRFSHLLRHGNVQVTDVWEMYARGSRGHALVARLGRWLQTACHENNFLLKRLHRVPQAVSSFLFRRFSWEVAVNRYLDAVRPELLAFDHTDIAPRVGPQKYPPYGNGEIAQWGGHHRCPIVAFPHGLLLYPPEETHPAGNQHLNRFDRLFVESERRKRLFVESGVEASRMIVSGSARYDPWWLQVLAGLLPGPGSHPGSAGKYVITFFATKMVYPYDFALLLQWLRRLASVEGVFLIVQPHPRGQKAAVFQELLSCPTVRIDTTTPAAVLINHSQAVSTLVSSVIVDALCKHIPVLYPKFLHHITTWFEEWRACLILHSLEETPAAVAALRAGWSPEAESLEGFLRHEVYGGGDAGTLARIAQSIEPLLKTE